MENLFTSHEFNMDHYTEINPKMSEISKGLAPVYKRPILGTEKHMAEIIYNLELVFKERDFRLLN